MKTLRALFAAALLVGLFAQTAGASPAAVGFMPLLSSVDASVPIEIQTHDAMRAVLPSLMAAQARGEILEFEPSLSTGVLKILYGRAWAAPAELAGRPVLSDMRQAVSSVPRPQAADVPVIGPEAVARFSMRLYDNCFKATGLSTSAHVTGSLRDTTGRSIALYDDHADAAGNITFGCFSWTGAYSDVIPGYKVTFKEYSGTTGTLLNTYISLAPNVRYTSIDKLNSIVRGVGPASKPFIARWYHRYWNSTNQVINLSKSATVTSKGTWGVDLSNTVKIRGNDHLNMVVTTNTYFDFDRWMDVPHIYCILGSNYCEVSGYAFGLASLKMVRGTTTYSYGGRFGSDGYFRVAFQNAAGAPIFLRTGDQVSGTGVAAFRLPTLTTAVNTTTNVVSGRAPANSYFDLWVTNMGTGVSYKQYGHATSLGNYSSDFTSLVDITSQPFSTQVYYTNPLTGNAVDFFSTFGP